MVAGRSGNAHFRILDLAKKKGLRALYGVALASDRGDLAMLRTLEVALGHAKSAVVEDLYVDYEYESAYSKFYSRVFRKVDKWCQRIHFFSCSARELSLRDLTPHQKDYLGFSVVRPLSALKTGRTVLRPPIAHAKGLEFHLAVHDHQVNLAGTPLSIRGAAFIEQDTRTAACASAAIWMATVKYAPELGLRSLTSAEITELATTYDVSVGRAMPSEGLNTSQMLQALRAMGFDPIVYGANNLSAAKSALYSYVESQIPVIIGVRLDGDSVGHAVTAFGHSYDAKRKPNRVQVRFPDGEQVEFCRSSEWTDSFLVNDDQRGPYRRFRFLEPDEYPPDYDPLKKGKAATPEDTAIFEMDCGIVDIPGLKVKIPSDKVRGVILYMLIPLPAGVSLRAEEAEVKSINWIRAFPHAIHAGPASKLRKELDRGHLVLRTYLRPSNQFKVDVFRRPGMNKVLKDSYRTLALPKYVWVTEVSRADYMAETSPAKRLMFGEILNDATANPHTDSYVAIHLPGWFSKTGPEQGDPDLALSADTWRVLKDEPYPHLTR